MCYTGKCPYEVSGGPCAGDCTIFDGSYPDDACCILTEREREILEIEQQEEEAAREEALGELEGFEPGMATKELQGAVSAIKAHCVRCPHAATCGHSTATKETL